MVFSNMENEEVNDLQELIRKENEKLDRETQAIARRATFFDAGEICLEIAIVLCSIALLTNNRLFWRVSFVGAAAGVAVGLLGSIR
jgi:hypothetical protein